MLNLLKNNANLTYTENGALTNSTSGSYCLDLFFRAGGMRNAGDREIAELVFRSYCEDPEKTMKIVFFIRDARGGLGERRFFRTAVKALAEFAPEAVERNIGFFSEYGRFDDLCALLDTNCADAAVKVIAEQLTADTKAMNNGGKVSLLAKWLPSVNASSEKTRLMARELTAQLGMKEKTYRKTLSELRRYTDIIENRLRTADYSFDYEKQCSRAMFKYKQAFIRNDKERYMCYLKDVSAGKASYNSSQLFPYDITRNAQYCFSAEERLAVDTAWKNLPVYGANEENALAVIDSSGSMTWSGQGNVAPIDAALSLGIYFAEHNKGAFKNHFITFSTNPRLVEIKGSDIHEKVNFCRTFNEVADTNLEAVFELVLSTAVMNKLPQSELPRKLYIISDMEFNYCVVGGNDDTLFRKMKQRYAQYGYELPDIVFWNVASRHSNIPVSLSDTGAALVSGFSPAIFDMVIGGDINPAAIMERIISSERYARVG